MRFDELETLILNVFSEESNLDVAMTKNDVPSWDSFGHLNLILELEDFLGISFTKEEIESIDSFSILLEVVNSKLKTS